MVSFAYMTNLITLEELTRSLISKVNRTGPRRDPRGTPDVTESRLDVSSILLL